MGAVLARVSSSVSSRSSQASWDEDDVSDFGSALSQPVTHPRPISDEIIEATGRGMVGENLLFAGDWPLPNHTSAQSEPQINNSGLDTGYEREERPRSEDLYLDMEVGGKRESWDGIGSDGERHVRWKGLHA